MDVKLNNSYHNTLSVIFSIVTFSFLVISFPLSYIKFVNLEIKLFLLILIIGINLYLIIFDNNKSELRLLILLTLALTIYLTIINNFSFDKLNTKYLIFLLLAIFLSNNNRENYLRKLYFENLKKLIFAFSIFISICIIINFFNYLIFNLAFFNDFLDHVLGDYENFYNIFGIIIPKHFVFGDQEIFLPRSFFFFTEPTPACIFLTSILFFFNKFSNNNILKFLILLAACFTLSGFIYLFIFFEILKFFFNKNLYFNYKFKIYFNITLILILLSLFLELFIPNFLENFNNLFSSNHRMERIRESIFSDSYNLRNFLFGNKNLILQKNPVISGLFDMYINFGFIYSAGYLYLIYKIIADINTKLFFLIVSIFTQFQFFYLLIPIVFIKDYENFN
jgi:hypothetical protein